jgi:hypothetical protein
MAMEMHITRGRDGQVIGTVEAGEIQTAEGTVELEPVLEDGQAIETIELRRSETIDLDALYKRLARKKK